MWMWSTWDRWIALWNQQENLFLWFLTQGVSIFKFRKTCLSQANIQKTSTGWGPPDISCFIKHEITPMNTSSLYLPCLATLHAMATGPSRCRRGAPYPIPWGWEHPTGCPERPERFLPGAASSAVFVVQRWIFCMGPHQLAMGVAPNS